MIVAFTNPTIEPVTVEKGIKNLAKALTPILLNYFKNKNKLILSDIFN